MIGKGMFGSKKEPPYGVDAFLKKAAAFDPLEVSRYEEWCRILRRDPKSAVRRKLGLKLLVLSDTHGYLAFGDNRLPRFLDTIGEFDLCVLLGDIHPLEMPILLDCIPKEEIIAIKGNHDEPTIYSDFGVRDLSGKVFEHRGVRFAGIDGSFRYKSGDYPSHMQYESLRIADALPEADVLLTHDVPLERFDREPAHAGLIGITHYIYSTGVPWHLHGHIHRSYEREYENGTREKSVYQCEYVEI